jgi:hypothetical protein
MENSRTTNQSSGKAAVSSNQSSGKGFFELFSLYAYLIVDR